jgi:hypothetical protein
MIMRPYIVGILTLLLLFSAVARPGSDVNLIRKDGNSITLELTPAVVSYTKSGFDQKSYTLFSFAHSLVEIDSSSGDLRFVGRIPLLIPSEQYTLTIVQADSRIESINNYPTAQALIFETRRIAGPAAPESRFVDLREISAQGSGFAGTLVYRPVEKLDGNRVKIYTHIVVRLTFTASIPASLQCLALLNSQTAAGALHSVQLKKTALQSNKILQTNETLASSASVVSPISQGTWYRLGITETGIYKLDYSFFKNKGIADSFWKSLQKIHIYGNGGAPAPESLSKSYPSDLQEIRRFVVDKNNDSTFDDGDYIVFYGKATHGWTYSSSSKTFNHYNNPYADTNYYFITSTSEEGDSMNVLSSAADTASASLAAAFTGKILVEEDKYNFFGSGREWVGQQFTSASTSVTYTNLLSGLIAGSTVTYRFSFYSRSATNDYLNITENGKALASSVALASMAASSLSSGEGDYAVKTSLSKTLSGAISADAGGSSSSILKINFTTSNASAFAWLDWIEILYKSSYTAADNFLLCSSPDTTALIKYSVSNLSSADVFVFDVTQHDSVLAVKNFNYKNGVCEFFLNQTAGSIRELAVVGSDGLKSVQSVSQISTTQNLHSVNQDYNFIIITPSDFQAAAYQLKSHRQNADTIKTIVVDIQDVFKEFSGGLQDPTGIRNFLSYAHAQWSTGPQYVLLLGEGHYDYRKIGTTAKNWIIPYESDESVDQVDSYSSDDYYVRLVNGDQRPKMAIGRIPVRSASDALQAVNKIISYETESPQDVWRNCITYVGDDQYATRIIGDTSLISSSLIQHEHCEASEALAENHTPDSFEKKKILLPAYPDVVSASGRHKPAAAAAIIDAINSGTLVLNYIGHANDQLWSHTEVFTQDVSLPSLTNAKKLAFFLVAGCSYGKYDNPSSVSAGEQLVTMTQGGAIADVSASRIVYDINNIALDDYLFDQMFTKDATGNPPRIGDAVMTAKQVYTDINSQKYHLFGDPTVRLAMPRLTASIDSINGKDANSSLKLPALGLVQAKGSITKNSKIDSTFNGTGFFTIYDAYKYLKFNGFPSSDSFKVLGSALYSGTVSLANGMYTAKGPIPKDVTYGRQARLSLYAYESGSDAVGYNEMLAISGIDTTAASDAAGPVIDIYLNDLSFQSGDVVGPAAMLIVKLSDSSGINTSTSGVGHQMNASLTNPSETIALSGSYRGDLDTYKAGTVTYSLSGLTEGNHTLEVKAWDIYNNASEQTISFTVKSGDETAMSNVFNYPNPFSSSTIFTFQRNSADPIEVEIKIYTIAGRCIRVIHGTSLTSRFVQVPWDGTDAEGSKIANGIYLYRITARSLSSNSSSEYIGKLARVH